MDGLFYYALVLNKWIHIQQLLQVPELQSGCGSGVLLGEFCGHARNKLSARV